MSQNSDHGNADYNDLSSCLAIAESIIGKEILNKSQTDHDSEMDVSEEPIAIDLSNKRYYLCDESKVPDLENDQHDQSILNDKSPSLHNNRCKLTDSNEHIHENANVNNSMNISESMDTDNNVELSDEDELIIKNDNSSEKNTKKMSKLDQELLKKGKLQKQHEVHPPCNSTCRLKCSETILETTRKLINQAYWDLNWYSRRTFIINRVRSEQIKRRKSAGNEKRNNQYSYHLINNKIETKVCKTFFLTTLGYKANNDFIIRNAFGNIDQVTLKPKSDGRGKQTDSTKLQRHGIIKNHIESYHPNISHYRRVHAPNRRYLPNTLNISDMHAEFTQKNHRESVSYHLYRSVFEEMNISFTKLGHEECELCEKFNMHNKDHTKDNLYEDCNICQLWSQNRTKYIKAREKYQKDVENISSSPDTIYYSVDLEKVIMLPHMEQFKTAAFARRIIAFNQSFIPLGSISNERRPIAVIWHEGIAGRKKEDIVSTFYSFFLTVRDKKRIILWLDNCAAQNKNWCLLSFFIYIINSDEVEAEFIEINYFESGHTFMAADAFHHQVELAMKKMKNVYDFIDYETAVGSTNAKKVTVKSLSPFNFYNWIDYSSKTKLKKTDTRPYYLQQIKQLTVSRGSYKITYKLTYDETEKSRELDFIQSKIIKKDFSTPEVIGITRGIPSVKKQGIINNLVPLMPSSRRQFWKNIPEANVNDLIDNHDNE